MAVALNFFFSDSPVSTALLLTGDIFVARVWCNCVFSVIEACWPRFIFRDKLADCMLTLPPVVATDSDADGCLNL